MPPFEDSLVINNLEFEARKFHENHPEVWDLFVKFAREARRRGFKKYSADAVMHRVRWETGAGAHDDSFKISNSHVAYYSRWLMEDDPKFRGFFRTRSVRST